jgi:hypothetical protein
LFERATSRFLFNSLTGIQPSAFLTRSGVIGFFAPRSSPRQTELLGHPIGGEPAPSPGPVIGNMIAVLDVQKFDRTRGLVSETLGVTPVHQPILLSHQNE